MRHRPWGKRRNSQDSPKLEKPVVSGDFNVDVLNVGWGQKPSLLLHLKVPILAVAKCLTQASHPQDYGMPRKGSTSFGTLLIQLGQPSLAPPHGLPYYPNLSEMGEIPFSPSSLSICLC